MASRISVVLEFINEIREEIGLRSRTRILKGRRRTANLCPIARSIGAGTNVGEAEMEFRPLIARNPKLEYSTISGEAAVVERDLPDEVREFVELFDAGKYPRLILRR